MVIEDVGELAVEGVGELAVEGVGDLAVGGVVRVEDVLAVEDLTIKVLEEKNVVWRVPAEVKAIINNHKMRGAQVKIEEEQAREEPFGLLITPSAEVGQRAGEDSDKGM